MSATNYPAYCLTNYDKYMMYNYVVFTDNWFTTIPSCLSLLEKGIYQVGTVRANRVGTGKNVLYPDKGRNVARGNFKVSKHNSNELFLISWMDNKVVNMLSTISNMSHIVKRTLDNGTVQQVRCPTAVSLYRKCMGGTDTFDQKLSYYWPCIKSMKWPIRVFIHFLYVAVVNSHMLMRDRLAITKKHKHFLLRDYISSLIEKLARHKGTVLHRNPVARRSKAKLEEDPFRCVGIHTPANVAIHAEYDGTRDRIDKRRVCPICNERSTWECYECNVGLCLGGHPAESCWRKYHTSKQLT